MIVVIEGNTNGLDLVAEALERKGGVVVLELVFEVVREQKFIHVYEDIPYGLRIIFVHEETLLGLDSRITSCSRFLW